MSTDHNDYFLAIITPTYRRPDRIYRLHNALCSLKKPDGMQWLHVVVDDASPDISEYGLQKSAETLIMHCREKNGGPLKARNDGIDIAIKLGANILAFIDDDDLPTGTFFEHVDRMWRRYRDVGWFISRCQFIGEVVPSSKEAFLESGLYDYIDNLVIKKSFSQDLMHVITASRLKGLRFSKIGRYQREWTLLLKVAKKGPFYYDNLVTKVSEYLPNGITRTRTLGSAIQSQFNMIDKTVSIFFHRPLNFRLFARLVSQIALFTPRLICILVLYFYRHTMSIKSSLMRLRSKC